MIAFGISLIITFAASYHIGFNEAQGCKIEKNGQRNTEYSQEFYRREGHLYEANKANGND